MTQARNLTTLSPEAEPQALVSLADAIQARRPRSFDNLTAQAHAWLIDRVPGHVTFAGIKVADLEGPAIWDALDHDYLGGAWAFVERAGR